MSEARKLKFKVGDLVRLKSGGPKMTVAGYVMPQAAYVQPDEPTPFYVQCDWFPRSSMAMCNGMDADNAFASEPSTADFTEDSLELVTP